MELLHYSFHQPLASVGSWAQEEPTFHGKPRGLWVSVKGEDDWYSWCKAEDFPIGNLVNRIVLKSDVWCLSMEEANKPKVLDKVILLLSSAEHIHEFTRKYTKKSPGYHDGIDWRKVASKYRGIVIAPYVWSCRLKPETSWYYGWDCASGCIWDGEVVERIELLGETPISKPLSEEQSEEVQY